MGDFIFTDRYDALGMKPPDPATMCNGQCEGIGRVPVSADDPNDDEGPWYDLWLEAENKSPSDDGYHFVICPRCKGTGKEDQTTPT